MPVAHPESVSVGVDRGLTLPRLLLPQGEGLSDELKLGLVEWDWVTLRVVVTVPV